MLNFIPLLFASSAPAQPADPLADGFRNPPAWARPHTWWHWMNGNVTKAGITADLKAMAEVGIGGAQMFTVDQGIPHGPVDYNSSAWREMTAYAVEEAAKNGLELCIHNCAGWSSSGGPWIDPDHAMKVVGWSAQVVTGPSHFSSPLNPIAAPQVVRAYDYRRDIVVIAFPTPSTPPRMKDLLGRTGVVRQDGIVPFVENESTQQSVPKNSMRVLRVDPDGRLDWDVPPGEWTILRLGYTLTGKDNHPAPPEGDGLEVDKLSREAMDVHWRGMMAKVIEECGPLAGRVLNNALIDSYEVGSQNWTPNMLEEFRKRRGYDMTRWLPAIAGYVVESQEQTDRFLWDLRKTIADLYAENYFGYFGQLCHKAGLKFSTEPYGNGGFDCITSGGTADIPMGEFWIGGGAMDTTRIAASVGHIYGRPVIGAESFTADDVRGKFLEEPYAIKAIGDLVFCNGINRYIFHRYAMQPWTDLKPGMTMGPWGTHLERTQTWWEEAKAWMKYIARCQYLLQQGQFQADILYYAGEHSPVDWIYGPSHNPRPPMGYDYDSCDAASLLQLRVDNGQLTLPSGMKYRVLVLPDSAFMTVGIARKLRELVLAGATVVGRPPEHSPTLTNYPQSENTVRAIAAELWGGVDRKTIFESRFGKGKVVNGRPIEEVLKNLQVQPDFETRRLVGSPKLVSIHRKIGATDLYFVSNQNYQPVRCEAVFRVNGKQPELWRADTGTIENAPIWREDERRTAVQLSLAPAESVFVLFRSKPQGAHLVQFNDGSVITTIKAPTINIISARYEAADGRGATVTSIVQDLVKRGEYEIPATNALFGDPVVNVVKRLVVEYTIDGKRTTQTIAENETLSLYDSPKTDLDMSQRIEVLRGATLITSFKPGRFSARTSANKKIQFEISKVPAEIDLSHDWEVRFDANMGAPARIRMQKLSSWTESGDEGIKYYSGSAVYAKQFNLTGSTVGAPLLLDLGKVKNFATVTLNGKTLQPLWKEPFVVDVSGLAKAGRNVIEIKVTNLWVNRLIGDEQLPPDAEWNGVTLKAWPDWMADRSKRPHTGRKTFVTWKFWSKDSKLLESGLLGPVSLRIGVRQKILQTN